MGGVIRNRRLVREKPEGGLITRLPPTTRFPRSGWRGLLPNDANVPIPAGLCRGSARWALITPVPVDKPVPAIISLQPYKVAQPDNLC